MIINEKKKRGRKSKAELESIKNNKNVSININEVINEVKIPKKRGRKPKGGKIIENIKKDSIDTNIQPNIILHLKCTSKDLINKIHHEELDSYIFSDSKTNNLEYDFLKKKYNKEILNSQENNEENIIDIYKKINELSNNLHTNDIPDKKCACFWCTYDFDNPPIYIPKYLINNSYHVYGCFCCLECACAYLMEENIDQANKFERYSLLNYIYGKVYNYEKNIKPAPNPYYLLDKYYGNLSIQEYRKLLKTERLLLIIDKPLSRQLPELHEDNNDNFVKSNISNSRYKIKKSQLPITKNNIMQEQFNLS